MGLRAASPSSRVAPRVLPGFHPVTSTALPRRVRRSHQRCDLGPRRAHRRRADMPHCGFFRPPSMGAVGHVLVFTFPGQGSQRAGMGEPWVDHPSWEVVEEASAAADRDLARLLLHAPIEELTQTENAQLATTVLSLVVLDAVERIGLTPAACAGHSLGEYTALVASGSLGFDHGIQLVVARGEAMARAGEEAPGTMAALLGIADDDAEAACMRAEGDVWVANYNAPGQVVIAGHGRSSGQGRRTGQGPRCQARHADPGLWRLPHAADAGRTRRPPQGARRGDLLDARGARRRQRRRARP